MGKVEKKRAWRPIERLEFFLSPIEPAHVGSICKMLLMPSLSSSYSSLRCCSSPSRAVVKHFVRIELKLVKQLVLVFFDNAFRPLDILTLILSVNIRYLIASSSFSISTRRREIYDIFYYSYTRHVRGCRNLAMVCSSSEVIILDVDTLKAFE